MSYFFKVLLLSIFVSINIVYSMDPEFKNEERIILNENPDLPNIYIERNMDYKREGDPCFTIKKQLPGEAVPNKNSLQKLNRFVKNGFKKDNTGNIKNLLYWATFFDEKFKTSNISKYINKIKKNDVVYNKTQKDQGDQKHFIYEILENEIKNRNQLKPTLIEIMKNDTITKLLVEEIMQIENISSFTGKLMFQNSISKNLKDKEEQSDSKKKEGRLMEESIELLLVNIGKNKDNENLESELLNIILESQDTLNFITNEKIENIFNENNINTKIKFADVIIKLKEIIDNKAQKVEYKKWISDFLTLDGIKLEEFIDLRNFILTLEYKGNPLSFLDKVLILNNQGKLCSKQDLKKIKFIDIKDLPAKCEQVISSVMEPLYIDN